MCVERTPKVFYCTAQFGALAKYLMGTVVGNPRALISITPPVSPPRAAIGDRQAKRALSWP
jgi:hypothetical protein